MEKEVFSSHTDQRCLGSSRAASPDAPPLTWAEDYNNSNYYPDSSLSWFSRDTNFSLKDRSSSLFASIRLNLHW